MNMRPCSNCAKATDVDPMYIVTFYSYKGGVGRTMALINIAAMLAKKGRKVLIVDFDLEAPGISTYGPFSNLTETKGVVDYVTEYIRTATAPKATEFIAECALGGANVWVMPAGQQNREYAPRLHSIDWAALYEVHSGYLFFEDLKQQWREQQFDYVLVDSRTGHTDVGGICTRQLPDAVVLMFFPNEQNLLGLEDVARNIRDEAQGPRPKNIFLHFCASNVPDLDDEDHILEQKLADAKARLAYNDGPTLIHHYNSLTLLNQTIFSLDRPESRLAKEYGGLESEIVLHNLQDRDGALSALNKLRDAIRTHYETSVNSVLEETLSTISKHHPDDGDIAWRMANISSVLGDLAGETEQLTVAIKHGVSEMTALRRRAAIARLQGRQSDALQDLKTVVTNANVSPFDFLAGVELLREIDQNWIALIQDSPNLAKLDLEQVHRLSTILMTDIRGSKVVVSLIMSTLARNQNKEIQRETMEVRLVLALISLKRFREAMIEMGGDHNAILQSDNVVVVFNFAMAEWGATGEPPSDLMKRVLELSDVDDVRSVNRFQCFAFAHHVCGDKQAALKATKHAMDRIEGIRGREFSCWRYLEVTRSQMQDDLNDMERMIGGERLLPAVFNGDLEHVES
jgi:cellulose biosynthesis protein BcsQ